MKISDKVYWFIQNKINSATTTMIMIAVMIGLFLYLLLTGQLFKNLPHWIDNPKW